MSTYKRLLQIPSLLLFFLASYLHGQTVRMQELTIQDGLSQGFVPCMLQDSEGFLWFGTKNGLNRYDGYRFEIFTNDPYDKNSLSSDYINCLHEAGDYLLVATMDGGLNFFHKKTRRVVRFGGGMAGAPNQFERWSLFWVSTDAEGHIWASAGLDGEPELMCKITLPQDFWQKPFENAGWQKQIQIQTWKKPITLEITMLPDGKLVFVPTPEGLYEVDTKSGEWKKWNVPSPLQKGDVVKTVKSNSKGGVWASRERDVLHLEGDRWKSIPVDDSLTRVLRVDEHYLWLIFPWDIVGFPLDKIGNIIRNQDAALRFPVPPSTYCGLIDWSGTVWANTMAANGVIKFNTGASRFRHFFPGQNINAAPFFDEKGNVCFFDYEKGYRSSPVSTSSPVPQLKGIPGSRIVRDNGRNKWVTGRLGRDELALVKIEPGGRQRTYPLPISGAGNGTGNTALDEKGKLWLAMYGRLFCFDQTTEQFSIFDYRSVMPELHLVYALAKTPGADGKTDDWWLGTEKGLVRITINNLTIQPSNHQAIHLFKNEPGNRNSLRNNKVSSLLADPTDPHLLWIGTKGGGLNRLDTRTMQFTHLTTREGLPNDVIYGVLADDNGHLWLSSNKGIIRYTPSLGLIKNYTEEDGVQSNEFNSWAYGKAASGEMLFGGVNGVNVFHPEELDDKPFVPNVFITGLRINDKVVNLNDSEGLLKQAVEFTEKIVLPFSKNNVALEFASLDFAIPAKNRYRYYLEGIEKPWSHESTGNTASYLKLAPGHYTFYVKGSNSDGVFNEKPALLKITILPPWYQTWWAYLIYLLLLGGGIYGFYRYQLRRKLEHAENLRLKEMDAFKSRFFTNISHEFRTPLTVILGTTEQLVNSSDGINEEVRLPKTKFQNQMALIKRNGENLLRLINQILDLAKLESDTLKLHYIRGDVLAYLRYIVESLHSFAAAKNISLRIESGQPFIVMDYDPERLLQIVHNLLSNAVKFTPPDGRVTLRAEVRSERREASSAAASSLTPHLSLLVSDTGVGIPPEDLPLVFDRYFQAKNQEQNKAGGTGIGLSLTKELVKAMGGDISVESEVGKGTRFTVVLPVTNRSEKREVRSEESVMENIAVGSIKPTSLQAPHPSPLAEPSPLTPHLSLLIIEDNSDIIEYLTACLSENDVFNGESYRLDVAYNGREGIEKALEIVPDIIISDVMMPEKDGFEVCDFLKNDERTSHIPIVLLTAKATVEDRIAGLRRGADAYLAKPFHPEELLVTLAKLVELRKKLQAKYGNTEYGMRSAELEVLSDSALRTPHSAFDLEDAFLQKVRKAVENHLSDSEFDMPQLEQALAMSRSQVYRKIKALTGKSPSLFIRSVRLQNARKLLETTSLTVSEIAYEVGFSTPAYFSTAYLEEFGIRPNETRK